MLLAGAVCAVQFAAAAEDKQQKVQRLLAMTKMESAMAQAIGPMMDQIVSKSMADGRLITPEKRVTVREIANRESASIIHDMRPHMEAIYAETLTEPEIDAMLAFYGSPAGQSILAKMPVVMSRITQDMMTAAMPRFQAMGEHIAQVLNQ
jgi:hypothetical protein